MSKEVSEPSKRARLLWDRLRQWYGVRLSEAYGLEPPAEWQKAVDNTHNDAVKRALELCSVRHPTHPPTLLEFQSLLKPPPGASARKASPQDKLADFVMRHRHPTPEQCRLAWTYLHTGDAFAGGMGFAVTGVVIPATDDGGQRIRVMVEDLAMEDAA